MYAHLSIFIFAIQSGNINETLKKNGIMKLQQHTKSQACFYQRAMCIKGLFAPPPPPMRLKYKNCFSPICSYKLINNNNNQSIKVSNYFDFYRCYGNKNDRQNRLKIGNLPFWSKIERFYREINIEHKQIQKNVTKDEDFHGTQHIKGYSGI